MDQKDIDALVGALAPVIKAHVDSAVRPLDARLKAAEAVVRVPGPAGEPGKDGPSEANVAAMVARAIAALPPAPAGETGPAGQPGEPDPAGKDGHDAPSLAEVKALVTEAVAALPPAPAGQPGRDGKDADAEAITAVVLEKALTKVAEIPAPKDGAPGADGKDGQPGRDGKDADAEAIAADVIEQVTEVLKAIPPPKDGRDGRDGKDGTGLAGALIDRAGELVVTLTDGSQRQLGPVVGKDGTSGLPGKDGADALGFDDLSIEFDGERAFKFVMVRGGARKEFGPFAMPVVIDRGVFKEGTNYQRGDGTTWGGSFWIAQEDTADKPETSKAWRLAVKRGRDGKDGVMKAAFEPKPVSLAR